MLIKIVLLAALISWHTRTTSGKAMQFAGLYAGVLFIPGLMGMAAGGGLMSLALDTAIRFALAALYFWLLDRFHGFLGWVITLVGAVAMILLF